MELTLEGIHHDEYGSIRNLKIQIPVLRSENLKFPPILADKSFVDSFLDSKLSDMRKMSEDQDDETLLCKMYSRFVQTAFVDRSLIPGSAELDFVFQVNCSHILGNYTDEVSDIKEHVGVEVGYEQFVQRFPQIEKYMENRVTETEIQTAMKSSDAQHVQDFFPEALGHYTMSKEARQRLEDSNPSLKGMLDECHSAGMSGAAAIFMSLDSDDYSESTLEEIQSMSTTPTLMIEILAGLRNFKVDDKIRKSFLFQRVLNRVTLAVRGVMNIMTLQDDTDCERDKFNTILRRAAQLELTSGSMTSRSILEAAMESRVNDLKDQLKDLQVMIRKLEKCYPLDKGLAGYLEIVQDVFDAQLMMLVYSPEFEYLQPKLIVNE